MSSCTRARDAQEARRDAEEARKEAADARRESVETKKVLEEYRKATNETIDGLRAQMNLMFEEMRRLRGQSGGSDCIAEVRNRSKSMKLTMSSENSIQSFLDHFPRCKRFQRLRNGRRNLSSNQKKLDTNVFESYLGDLWSHFSEEKRSPCTYLDCLWFYLYKKGCSKKNVLEWIQKKQIFSWEYVFVPIVCWGHWSLLILCHFGEYKGSKDRKPYMLLLDSRQKTDPKRLEPFIRRFVSDIFKSEQRKEDDEFISQIPLLVPKVPQQRNGEECGIFVLYFIYLFVKNVPEDFSQEGYPYFLNESWFNSEEVESFKEKLHSFG